MNRLYINKDWSTLKKLIAINAAGGAPLVEYTATGNPATFKTNVAKAMEMIIPFNPVQDLHGYEFPWVGGAGKNLADPSKIAHASIHPSSGGIDEVNEEYRTVVIENLPAGSYTFSTDLPNCYIIRCQSGGTTSSKGDGEIVAIGLQQQSYSFSTTNDGLFMIAIRDTSTSAITTEPNCQIEAGSTASAFTPYSNICPISGWTGANVTRTGKNFIDISLADWKSRYLINDSGEEVSNSSYKYTQYFYRVNGGGTAAVSFVSDASSGAAVVLVAYDINKNFISRVVIIEAGQLVGGYNKSTIQIPTDTAYVRFNAPRQRTLTDFMLEYAPDATTYEPFGTTYSITFPSEAGTVYGGTLTVNKDGTGVLTCKNVGIKLNDLSWDSYSAPSDHVFRADLSSDVPDTKYPPNANTPTTAITDSYRSIAWTPFTKTDNGRFALSPANTHRIVICDHNYSTVEAFTTARGNDTVVIPLTTPVTYTLTAEQVGQILALKGTNNVWSDTNDSNTIKYMKKG